MYTKEDILKIESKLTGTPSKRKRAIVNMLRHMMMDDIKVDTTDNEEYLTVFIKIMRDISTLYPHLSSEVQRQIDKKIRWQSRRSHGQ